MSEHSGEYCSPSCNNILSCFVHSTCPRPSVHPYVHPMEMNRRMWTHGDLSIDPTNTFTPATFYTVGAISQRWLNWPANQWHKVTICFSGHLTALFTCFICLFFNHFHPTWLQMAKEPKNIEVLWQIRWCLIYPCFPFFLYWHNIQKWPFSARTPDSPLLFSISLPLAFTEA